jgi:hypothetical protein
MHLDGQAVNPQVRGNSTNSTLFANFDPALDPGRHTVVLFASDDREASATAWAFTPSTRNKRERRPPGGGPFGRSGGGVRSP